jgi:anion-transporting  ArsA/GET3 family ATPase
VLNQLFNRRLLVLLGKGGVGKTAISAAIALAASRAGLRVLAVECDERGPLASIFGRPPSYDPIEVEPRLALMLLEGAHALEEYLRMVVPGRAVLGAVFSSRLYQYFVQAAPGLRELMMLGKLYYEIQRKPADHNRWDLIVLDAPASGQALSLLNMPAVARKTFGESVVGREASNINRMLRDPQVCALIQVTTAEAMALSETLETYEALKKSDLGVSAVILSRSRSNLFAKADVNRLIKRAGQNKKLKHLDYIQSLAHEELQRASAAREALALLHKRISAPIIELPDYRGLFGIELVGKLAVDLAVAPGAQPAAAKG